LTLSVHGPEFRRRSRHLASTGSRLAKAQQPRTPLAGHETSVAGAPATAEAEALRVRRGSGRAASKGCALALHGGFHNYVEVQHSEDLSFNGKAEFCAEMWVAPNVTSEVRDRHSHRPTESRTCPPPLHLLSIASVSRGAPPGTAEAALALLPLQVASLHCVWSRHRTVHRSERSVRRRPGPRQASSEWGLAAGGARHTQQG